MKYNKIILFGLRKSSLKPFIGIERGVQGSKFSITRLPLVIVFVYFSSEFDFWLKKNLIKFNKVMDLDLAQLQLNELEECNDSDQDENEKFSFQAGK